MVFGEIITWKICRRLHLTQRSLVNYSPKSSVTIASENKRGGGWREREGESTGRMELVYPSPLPHACSCAQAIIRALLPFMLLSFCLLSLILTLGRHRSQPPPSPHLKEADIKSESKDGCGKGLQWRRQCWRTFYYLLCPPDAVRGVKSQRLRQRRQRD